MIPESRECCSAQFPQYTSADGRCQTYADSSQYTVEIECHEQGIGRNTIVEEKEFRVVGAQCRQKEQDAGYEKRILTSQIGAKNPKEHYR